LCVVVPRLQQTPLAHPHRKMKHHDLRPWILLGLTLGWALLAQPVQGRQHHGHDHKHNGKKSKTPKKTTTKKFQAKPAFDKATAEEFWGIRMNEDTYEKRTRKIALDSFAPDFDHFGQASYCGLTPHNKWNKMGDAYYLAMVSAPCRFPDCQRACEANNASLVNPDNERDLRIMMQLAEVHKENIYLGIHLPPYMPSNSSCTYRGCDRIYSFSNGTEFTYQSWMFTNFDRISHQARCFMMTTIDEHKVTVPEPEQCDQPAVGVCKATYSPNERFHEDQEVGPVG